MSIGDNFKQLFNRVSKSINAKSSNTKLNSYKKLFERNDHYVPYTVGLSILRDTQVGTGVEILKYLLSSKEWILTNQEEDTTVFEFIEYMLQNMNTDINTLVKQMISAMLWGFSVHELMYDVVDGRLVVTDALPIHIKTLQNEPFIYDENGELIGIHQQSQENGDDVEIPVNKTLLYSYNSLYDEDNGRGLLYDFLPIVEDKENLMDWLMTFAERNGSPTMYGKTTNEVSRDQILTAFDDVADGTTGIVVGNEDELGILESSHNGETYFKTLAYKDNQIFRRMFIGNLLLGDNSQTGTYAQSQTQLEFGNMVFDGVLSEIAKVLQKQLIDPIVEFNFGVGRKSPVLSFDKFSKGDMQKLFNILIPLMNSGTVDSENDAVQEAIKLLFKAEAGVEYVNTEPVMPLEDFSYQEPVDTQNLTSNLIDEIDIDGVTE